VCPDNPERPLQVQQTARYFDDETIYIGICIALRQWFMAQIQQEQTWIDQRVGGMRLIGRYERLEEALRDN